MAVFRSPSVECAMSSPALTSFSLHELLPQSQQMVGSPQQAPPVVPEVVPQAEQRRLQRLQAFVEQGRVAAQLRHWVALEKQQLQSAAALSLADLRQAILLEFQRKDLSTLSVVVLRHSIEDRLGLGRDGLKARRHEISDLARELAEQPRLWIWCRRRLRLVLHLCLSSPSCSSCILWPRFAHL